MLSKSPIRVPLNPKREAQKKKSAEIWNKALEEAAQIADVQSRLMASRIRALKKEV